MSVTSLNLTSLTRPNGYDASRLNALQHGVLSQHTVLPWEDRSAFDELLAALASEHGPIGPTEVHLVEELAGIMWRKRRLRMAEAATHNRALHVATYSSANTAPAALVLTGRSGTSVDVARSLLRATEDAEKQMENLRQDLAMTERALGILKTGGRQAYDEALAALHSTTQEAWQEALASAPDDGDEPGGSRHQPTAAGLKSFLEAEILPWYDDEFDALDVAPKVRAQALAQSFDPDRLERLARYEVHLDRKLERTLAMLVRLQELRAQRGASSKG